MEDLYLYTTIALIPLVVLTLIAGSLVKVVFNGLKNVNNAKGLTASQVARKLLDDEGLFDVQIIKISGNLTDNYNPKTRVLALSESVHDSQSIAALGIAAHETGHAIQHSQEYGPLKLRGILVPVCGLTSRLAMPLLIIGLVLEIFFSTNPASSILFFVGVSCYGMYTLFTLITLPVEFNASNRAMHLLTEKDMINENDRPMVRRMLTAAAMTYVMSFALSLVQLLRIIAIFGGTRRKR